MRPSPFFQYCCLWNKCPLVDRILDLSQWFHPGNVGYPHDLFVLYTVKIITPFPEMGFSVLEEVL